MPSTWYPHSPSFSVPPNTALGLREDASGFVRAVFGYADPFEAVAAFLGALMALLGVHPNPCLPRVCVRACACVCVRACVRWWAGAGGRVWVRVGVGVCGRTSAGVRVRGKIMGRVGVLASRPCRFLS